jgi:molecular chaperone GrpE
VTRNEHEPRGESRSTEQDPARLARGDAGEQPREIPTPDPELTKLRTDNAQLEEQLVRALADLQNIRRRQRQEMDESRLRTLQGLCQELLPILDNFQMALQAWDEGKGSGDPKQVVEGVRMVRSMLTAALERHGLQEIPAAGQPFDPNLHEAVAVEARPGVPEGQVLQVLQPGYQIGDRIIRPSRVIVSGGNAVEGS